MTCLLYNLVLWQKQFYYITEGENLVSNTGFALLRMHVVTVQPGHRAAAQHAAGLYSCLTQTVQSPHFRAATHPRNVLHGLSSGSCQHE